MLCREPFRLVPNLKQSFFMILVRGLDHADAPLVDELNVLLGVDGVAVESNTASDMAMTFQHQELSLSQHQHLLACMKGSGSDYSDMVMSGGFFSVGISVV